MNFNPNKTNQTNENNEEVVIKETNEENEDYSVKVVIVGDSSVGKTNLLNRYVSHEFTKDSRATVGVELLYKTFNINGKIIKLHMWDTAGQERFKSITSAYYKGAKGCMIVYDITNRDSFNHIDKWYKEIKSQGGVNINIIICGNKSDLESERKVSFDEGLEVAKQNNVFFIETSALSSMNVDEAFMHLIKIIYINNIMPSINADSHDFLVNNQAIRIETSGNENKESKSGCC